MQPSDAHGQISVWYRHVQTEALPRGSGPASRPAIAPGAEFPPEAAAAAALQAELRKTQAALIFEAQQGYCNFKVCCSLSAFQLAMLQE